MSIKKCVCGVDKGPVFDGDRTSMAIGGVLQLLVIFGLSFAFGLAGSLLYLASLGTVALVMIGYFRSRRHKLKCATRRALLNVLNIGTFISPV